MSLQDPVSDMLTRIRNAYAVNKKTTQMPFSKIKLAISSLLKEEGYITDFQQVDVDGKSSLVLTLKYHLGSSVITKIRRVSRPGLRVYKNKTQLPKIQEGLGISIVSTSKGLMTDRAARASGYGGEVLCYVY